MVSALTSVCMDDLKEGEDPLTAKSAVAGVLFLGGDESKRPNNNPKDREDVGGGVLL